MRLLSSASQSSVGSSTCPGSGLCQSSSVARVMPGEQELEVVHRRQAIGVLLRNRLALLGEPQVPVQGRGMNRLDESMLRSSAPAHGAAAPVKKADAHAGFAGRLEPATPRRDTATRDWPESRRPCCCRCSRPRPAARGDPRRCSRRCSFTLRAVIGWCRNARRMSGLCARSSIVSNSGTTGSRQARPCRRADREADLASEQIRASSRSDRRRVMLTINAPRPLGPQLARCSTRTWYVRNIASASGPA